MNRKGLVKELARELEITQEQALRFALAWEKITKEALLSDGSLTLLGFGGFSIWNQKERMGRNPKDGTSCLIPPRASVKFKPGRCLLDDLSKCDD